MALSQTSIEAASVLAARLTRKNLTLVPETHSALASLMETGDLFPGEGFAPDAAAVLNPPVGSDPTKVVIAVYGTNEPGTPEAAHEEEMKRLVDQATRATAWTLDIARNKAMPMIKRVVGAVETDYEAGFSEYTSGLTIAPYFLPEVFNSTTMLDLLAPHAESLHQDITPVQLTAQWEGPRSLATGIASFDDAVVGLLFKTQATADATVRLWNSYFSNLPDCYRSRDFREDLKSPEEALVVFLGANALINNNDVPSGLGISLASYRAYLAQLLDQSAALLSFKLKGIASSIKGKVLTISSPKPGRPGIEPRGEIRVHGPVYNDWLRAGGSPEALKGAVLSLEPIHYQGALDSAKDNAARWERSHAINAASYLNNTQRHLVERIRLALHAEAAALSDAGESAYPIEDMDARINDQIAATPIHDFDDVYAVCENLVCSIFFGHTDVEYILDSINSLAKKFPQMDVSKVALLATIEYVTRWLSGMYEIHQVANVPESIAA